MSGVALFLSAVVAVAVGNAKESKIPLANVVSMRMPNTDTFGRLLKDEPSNSNHRAALLRLQKLLLTPGTDKRPGEVLVVTGQGLEAIHAASEQFASKKPASTYTPGEKLTAVFYAYSGKPNVRLESVVVKDGKVTLHYAWKAQEKGWKNISQPAFYSSLAFIPLPEMKGERLRVEVVPPKDTPKEILRRVCLSKDFLRQKESE